MLQALTQLSDKIINKYLRVLRHYDENVSNSFEILLVDMSAVAVRREVIQ